MDIREFVSDWPYRTLTELQSNAKRRENELEIQWRKERPTLVQLQLVAKRFKSVDSRSGPVK